MTDTKTRILDTAERLFAEHGVAGTSLRSVTTAANVNLAAVHYHFGSREALVHAVFERRIVPINHERLRRLDALEASGHPALEDVIDAFVGPAFELVRDPDGARFIRILARLFLDPSHDTRRLLMEFFVDVARRYMAALHRILGDDVGRDPFIDFKLVLGVMVHGLTMDVETRLLLERSGRAATPIDFDQVRRRVVAFVTAGLRATALSPDPDPDPEERS